MHERENKHPLLLLFFSIAALLLHFAHLFLEMNHPLTFGYLILLVGLLYIRRIISNNLMNDQFNTKNKLFKQEKKMITNPYSVNIKTADGYINVVNPFQATMVLGIPGSGKSFAIVEEFIMQHSLFYFT